MERERIRVICNADRTLIIGKCLNCGKTHEGNLAIGVSQNLLEIGVEIGDTFHPLESIRIKELSEALGVKNG